MTRVRAVSLVLLAILIAGGVYFWFLASYSRTV